MFVSSKQECFLPVIEEFILHHRVLTGVVSVFLPVIEEYIMQYRVLTGVVSVFYL